jgi:hypothetical protein
MTRAAGIRHFAVLMASCSLLALASHAAAEVSNIDPLQQRGPDDADISTDADSQLVDQGRVRDNDSVLHVGALGRTGFGLTTPGSRQGLGGQLDGFFALGEDQAVYPHIAPAEMVEVDAKVNYLYEALGPDDRPDWEIIPQYEYVTYPHDKAKSNPLKFAEDWLGSDLWWCSPVDGLEFGGGAYYDPRKDYHMVKGAFGAREFYQDAPFDLAGWQLINFGNVNYKRYFAGSNQAPPANPGVSLGGLAFFDLGGRVTYPLAWEDVWTYAQADWTYWMQKSDRQYLNSVGQNVGQFIIAFGAEWRPE